MKKAKVLLVENDNIVARDIENMLKGLGYDVPNILSRGKEAVENAKKLQPDLVLMDVKLQGEIDGVEAASRIYRNLNIPIVYITAFADEKTMERAKITEPFGYILKPFNERELQASIEIALYKHKMEVQLKQRERWLSTILKSIGDAVITTDKKGAISFMNPLAEKLTGWRQKNALNRPLDDVFRIKNNNSDKQLKVSVTEAIREKNLALPDDICLISKKEVRTPINIRAVPFTDSRAYPSGVVLSFTDISRRKRAEEELRTSWKNLHDALEATVHAVASTIETRDPYTAGHQRRVAKLASTIAEEMNLLEDRIEGLRMAADLHDIGKISVPAEILSKPGQISEVEYNIIKTHPQAGYEILKNIKFPWPIAQIVLQHHERMDGSGYPLGLRRRKIILEARILAVADVVEAMAAHRPYRPALSINRALEEISENKNKLYDSKVVEACLELFTEKGFRFE